MSKRHNRTNRKLEAAKKEAEEAKKQLRALAHSSLQNVVPIQANSDTNEERERMIESSGFALDSPSGVSNQQRTAGERDKSKKIEVWKFRLEILTFMVGLCLAIIYYLQMRANLSQAKAAQGQLDAMKVQMDANLRQAKAAENQLGEMRQESVLSERAWVLPYEIGEDPPSSDSMTFTANFKNTGKTPAIDVGAVIVVVLDPKLIPDGHEAESGIMNRTLLAPDEIETITTVQMPIGLGAAINSGQSIYIYGTIHYKDIFGAKHWSAFCRQITVNPMNKTLLRSLPYGKHNSCDDAEIDGK